MAKDVFAGWEKAFQDYQAVIQPDHPLLLRGPDALIAVGKGNLVAVFTPQTFEERNPAHLASRLIASRMALPSFCRTVFLFDADREGRFDALYDDFGLITSLKDRHLHSFINDRHDHGQSQEFPPDLKPTIIKQFNAAQSASEIGFRESRRIRRKSASRVRLSETRLRKHVVLQNKEFRYSPQNRVEFMGETASILTANDRHNLRRQLIATASGHLLEAFLLEQGIPYPKKVRPHVAFGDSVDDVFGLRSKAVLSAAFAGVSLVPESDPEVVEPVYERIAQQGFFE